MKSIGEISVSDAQRAGFREFSSCESGKQRSRRSLNIVARRGGGTDCAPDLAHCSIGHSRLSVNPNETMAVVPFGEMHGD
ncbi:hypothetical protein CO676_18060 [Sinorhizobium sp. BJ1]|nr:hypothetical protein CO676_18060 [Sinorhizobium sp. BJ1]